MKEIKRLEEKLSDLENKTKKADHVLDTYEIHIRELKGEISKLRRENDELKERKPQREIGIAFMMGLMSGVILTISVISIIWIILYFS